MKSLLVYANDDPGLEARLQAALDLARLFEGHLTCLQVSPYDAFILGDPFGGVYALPTVIEQVRKTADDHRIRIEERLRGEGADWEWLRVDGAPAQLLVERARLSDLIVLSLPGDGQTRPAEAGSLLPDILVHARSPVLAMPRAGAAFDPRGRAMIAWDGSLEASHALRLTLPMLARASAVDIVTVGGGSP
jgi:nucleotide-binding universal stress UspA family protein